MAEMKRLSLAIFETPTECRECPCVHVSPDYREDVCQLAIRSIESRTNISPIPDWCPLKPIIFDEEGYLIRRIVHERA